MFDDSISSLLSNTGSIRALEPEPEIVQNTSSFEISTTALLSTSTPITGLMNGDTDDTIKDSPTTSHSNIVVDQLEIKAFNDSIIPSLEQKNNLAEIPMTDKSEIETSTDLELLSTTKALTNATAYTEANNNTSFLEDDLVTTTTLNVDNDIDNAIIDTINVAKMSHNLVETSTVASDSIVSPDDITDSDIDTPDLVLPERVDNDMDRGSPKDVVEKKEEMFVRPGGNDIISPFESSLNDVGDVGSE